MSIRAHKFIIIYITALLALSGNCIAGEKAQSAEKFKLTIDNIMEGPALYGTAPSEIKWSQDGKQLYFNWKKPEAEKAELYVLNIPNKTPKKIDPDQLLKNPPLPPRSSFSFRSKYGMSGLSIKYNKNKTKALITRNGDIFIMSLPSGKIKRLTFTDDRESNVNFTFDQSKIFFTSQDNLYLLSIKDFSLRQMTSFTRKSPPPQKKPDEIAKWFLDQQKELFQQFNKKQNRMGQKMSFPGLDDVKKREPFYLKEGQNVTQLELSPCEKYVLFQLSERIPETKSTIVPNYVTKSGYTENITAHPKAAYNYSTRKTGSMDTATGKITWVDYKQEEKQIYAAGTYWSPDGKYCALAARSEDRNDAWLFLLDIKSGKTSIIEHVYDEAWIGRFGLTNISWWPNSKWISYISEKDGFAHLYKASPDGKEIIQLTKGKYEISQANLSEDGKTWYLTSNEEHPGERHLYSMPAKGGAKTKITSMKGHNDVTMSPDEKNLAILYSSSSHPAELYIQPNKASAKAEQVTISSTKNFRSYPWYKPEIITYKARDGVDVYARLYKPKKWHQKHPAVVFIHGAGYLQNAHKGWSGYSLEYMFHNFLLEQGYLVLDADYRGSAGYGRDCRTGIYRHMGGKDLGDVVDGAKYLIKEYGVDPKRIGTYGGSYGGFLTFMAMFTTPDVFAAGAALRPVTDWAHYHNSYTADILNLPHKDTEAYKKSSPIYFAEGLKGALLICHGMIDTNVHFQDTVRLVQRLIELRKENWECAFYPVESHGFLNSSSWADEYKRIFKLFENNLK